MAAVELSPRPAPPPFGAEEDRRRIAAFSDPGFLKNVWYVAGWASEFAGPGPFARRIADEPVVLYRPAGGVLTALADRCPHRWAPLSLGRVEGEALRCMYHGVTFGADGGCLEVPDQDRAAEGLRVRAYPLVERHRFAWIWMGEPARADAALIPDLFPLDHDDWRIDSGQLDYAANYALINDNLIDLSHVRFTHEKTFGATPPALNGSNAQAIARGVRTEGWAGAHAYGERMREVAGGEAPPFDLWNRVDYVVPGIFHSYNLPYAPDTGRSLAGAAPWPDHSPLAHIHSVQAVTPMTARSSRYFFSFCYSPGVYTDEQAAAQWKIILEAFDEDLVMIEAQQRNIDQAPGDRFAGIAADRGPTLFRRTMSRMMEAEQGAR